jgi:hypothetical protein
LAAQLFEGRFVQTVINICDPSTVEESFCDSALLAIEEAFCDKRKNIAAIALKIAF